MYKANFKRDIYSGYSNIHCTAKFIGISISIREHPPAFQTDLPEPVVLTGIFKILLLVAVSNNLLIAPYFLSTHPNLE